MNVYTVSDLNGMSRTVYFGTLAEAHTAAKTRPADRETVRVELAEVATDKAGCLRLMNGIREVRVLREWKLSPRGGLIEVEVGTDKPLKGIL